MRSAFDNLRLNPLHGFEIDVNGDKQVVKIFRNEQLIAKKITLKKSIRYFAVKGYLRYLTAEEI
ncbi:hypothetical protein [Colwellia sp. M166]|uniref:hypothetical protein n=1 Tax=Colwellia sp. M166 TaxID=2583805 RepID=UPI00211E70BE|nr:hypothetical protein [Colwellia sp. M166]